MGTLTNQSRGRYQIEAEIGRGAMGVVYRAYDPQIGRLVAIKTISFGGQEFAGEPQYRERFLREARAAGRLSHPGIVTIFDAGEDTATHEPYLVMEYVAGEPLSKILSQGDHKLPLSTALQFAQEIAEALDYAHTQGVIHRDIKPPNILVTEDGHAKIADFGVAWLNQEVTQTGEIVGSPAYMAPEQMAGKQADARSDLFSLGVVLYSMLTGFRPFQGNSAQTVCFKVMNIEPVPVTSFQSDLPPELDAIISRAIAKDPSDRYPSGAELAQAIRAFRETDWAFDEATNFFVRAVQQDVGPIKRSRAKNSNPKLSLAAAALGAALATTFFAWRMTHARNVPLPAELIAEFRSNPIKPHPAAEPQPAAQLPTAHKIRSHKTPTQPAAGTPLPAQTVASAKVQVEIQHHFNGAKASIWLDDELVFDQNLRGADQRHPFLRSVEVNQVTRFQFAPGKHWLQVRVVSPTSSYDQIETLETDLAPGSEHLLYVNCDKRKMQIMLQ